MTDLAPVAVFAYKRRDHLARALASLRENPEAAATDLVVFSDAARSEADAAAVAEVRAYVAGITGFKSLTRVERPANYGLARSIIEGVTQVVAARDRVIVVEDDLVLSPHFLRFMNDGLAVYAADPQVASIHGYSYPTSKVLPETFFLRGTDCWGWASWGRAWQHFRPDGRALLAELRSRRLCRAFDVDGTYPFTEMLIDQIAGRNNSWAIRWHASCFLDGMLTLFPGRTLVENIGFDASGTHGKATGDFAHEGLASTRVHVERLPLEESAAGRAALAAFYRARHGPAKRLLRRLQRPFRR